MEKNKTAAVRDNPGENDLQKAANRVSLITILGNVILSVIKLLAGILAHSSAMISDAVH